MSSETPPERLAKPEDFKPSRFMRARRPHLYSDSVTTAERTVTREVLSYHLETLANQKDETKFEYFAQRLAEKFISPNLRPQTGPVGGGDGKTDSETYPVSSEIASRWYVPDLAGAHERWACRARERIRAHGADANWPQSKFYAASYFRPSGF